MIFVLILLILLFSAEIYAGNCDPSFITVPKLYHKEGENEHCYFNSLIHINSDDRAAID